MDDLISRQDTIDALERKKDKNAKGDIGGFYNKIIQNDIDTLMQMPSAQPENEKRTAETAQNVPNGDLISRKMAIDALDVLCQEHRYKIPGKRETYSQYNEAWQDALDRAEGAIFNLPSAHPETYKEKLNEIASALSEKFAYMNTCPNERDIILGYLGVKRRCNTHCNTDCTNTKCESHPLSSAQPEIIHCRDCKHRGEKPIADGRYWCEIHDTFMYYCSDAERRTDEETNIS